MILSRPETGKAFEQLIASLEAEVQALNQLGSKVALAGEPKNATKVMRLAGERARLRDHVRQLHEQWQQLEPTGLAAITTPVMPSEALTPSGPTQKFSGQLLTIGEAARKVDVSPKQIREWIGSGKLPAQQGPSGRWRIPGPELIDCYRRQGAKG